MNIKLFFEQVFHKHAYKTLYQKYLRTAIDYAVADPYGYLVTRDQYSYYLETSKCLKCGKIKEVEKRYLDI